MTEMFRGAFNSIPCIDFDHLFISLSPVTQHESSGARRSMSVIEDTRVSYTFAWPIAIISGLIRLRSTSVSSFSDKIAESEVPAPAAENRKHRAYNGQTGSALHHYTLRDCLLWLTNTIVDSSVSSGYC